MPSIIAFPRTENISETLIKPKRYDILLKGPAISWSNMKYLRSDQSIEPPTVPAVITSMPIIPGIRKSVYVMDVDANETAGISD